MAEYIERGAALKIIDNYSKAVESDGKEIVKAVKDIVDFICPTADVQEVRHGDWIKSKNERKCSICGYFYFTNTKSFNYCPNCGAKMDKE